MGAVSGTAVGAGKDTPSGCVKLHVDVDEIEDCGLEAAVAFAGWVGPLKALPAPVEHEQRSP